MAQPANRVRSKHANSKSFQAGKSGNPDGRSKASHDARRLWESLLAQVKDGKPRVQRLLERYYEIACDDPATCRDAVNRILGKVPDVVQDTSRVLVTYVNDWRSHGTDSDASLGDEAGAGRDEAHDADPGGPALAQDNDDGNGQR